MRVFMFQICCFLLCISSVLSQNAKKVNGEIVKDYGVTFEVNNPDYKTDMGAEFKVIFDVDKSSEDKSIVNKHLEIAARFLNMHVNAGVKPEQLKVAMTIHADASEDVLNNDLYHQKFGVDNPNIKLINALSEAGVDIIFCGQAAAKRDITKEDIIPNVQIALSATTALIQYQNKGYRFIKY